MPPPIPLLSEGCMNRAGSQASSANSSSKDGSRRSSSSGREPAEDRAFCTDLMNRLSSGQSRIHCSWLASVFIKEIHERNRRGPAPKGSAPSTVDQARILVASEPCAIFRPVARGSGPRGRCTASRHPRNRVKRLPLHATSRSAGRGWRLSMPFQGLSGATIRPVGARVTMPREVPVLRPLQGCAATIEDISCTRGSL